jgi:hypothetical protein
MKAMNKKLFGGYLLTILSFLVLVTPTLILFFINYDTYIVSGETTKISLGAMLGIIFTLFIMNGAFRELNTRVATLISMIVFLIIIWFLESIIKDLFWVTLSVIVGYVFYLIISSFSKTQINEYNIYKDEKIRAKIRKQAQDEIVGV